MSEVLKVFPLTLPASPCDPMTEIDSKLTDKGVEGRTIVGGIGYPMLRFCVEFLKTFDQEGFDEYCEIKGIHGTKTPESRRAAYKFAWDRVGKMVIQHYDRSFTESPKSTEGEEWKKGEGE